MLAMHQEQKPKRRWYTSLLALVLSPLLWCSVAGMLWPKFYADNGAFDHVRGGSIKRRLYETLGIKMVAGATGGLAVGMAIDALISSVRRKQKP
jgi:hypothetical protein